MAAVAETFRDRDQRGSRWGTRPSLGLVHGGRPAAQPGIGNGEARSPANEESRGVHTAANPNEGEQGHGRGGNYGKPAREPEGYRAEGSTGAVRSGQGVPASSHPRQPAGQSARGYERTGARSDTDKYPPAEEGQPRQRQQSQAPQRGQEGQARRDQAGQDGPRDFHSIHVYGGKAALCFSADETRGGEHTVRVEGAPSKGQRSYDWGQKISLQFTSKELPKVLCVLMGWMESVDFQAHGVANDKAISMANQAGGKVFINLRQTKTARAVPVTAEDVFGIVDLVMKQMLKNSGHLTADSILVLTRSMAKRYLGA